MTKNVVAVFTWRAAHSIGEFLSVTNAYET